MPRTSTAPARFLALGRLAEAEEHAQDAVRLDPDEIRYRELLAQVLSAEGAHRDAAAEFGRLARNDPRQTTWTVAEAEERLGAAQAGMGVDAARRAVRLAPRNGRAQLALSHALARTGDARGAFQAATLATELLPGDAGRAGGPRRRPLAGRPGCGRLRRVPRPRRGAGRDGSRARARQGTHGSGGSTPDGRAGCVGAIGPLFRFAFRRGWLRIGR